MVVIGLVVAAMANLIVTVIPDNRNSTGLELCVISIITQVIIEILALSLAENGVIFRYNHLRRGDYSGGTNFQNGRFALC